MSNMWLVLSTTIGGGRKRRGQIKRGKEKEEKKKRAPPGEPGGGVLIFGVNLYPGVLDRPRTLTGVWKAFSGRFQTPLDFAA